MEKLTIKELAPYLPYGLKGYRLSESAETKIIIELDNYNISLFLIKDSNFKPILLPLSDLTKEIEVNGERFMPYKKIGWWGNGVYVVDIVKMGIAPYKYMQKLFEWHFDVFGLIEKGLAIDLNTL